MLILFLLNSIITLDSPLNTVIDYFQTRGLFKIQTIMPYEIADIVYHIDTLLLEDERLNKIDKRFVPLFGLLLLKSNEFYTFSNISGGKNKVDNFYTNIDLQSTGKIANNFFFAQGIRFHFSSNLDYSGPQPWKDIVQAYLNEGYLKYRTKNFNLLIGRRNLSLSFNDEHSLLLSPAKEGYDGFILTYDGKYYKFHSTFSVLDPEGMRFISTHRLGLNLSSMQVGFSEAILWGNEIEPLYLNFLLPYYLSQWGMYRNDNIMWCFDGSIKFSNTVIFGEFLIDDYQFSEPPPGYTEYPHKLAFQTGVKKLLFERFLFKLNYTFVDKWVYTHVKRVNIYENDSLCLGFPLGNDVDKWLISLKFFNDTKIFPKIRFEFTRKGEGSIYLPYEIERGSAYPEFPSGIVEKKITIHSGIECFIGRHLSLNIEAGREQINNFEHQSGVNKKNNILNASFWFIF